MTLRKHASACWVLEVRGGGSFLFLLFALCSLFFVVLRQQEFALKPIQLRLVEALFSVVNQHQRFGQHLKSCLCLPRFPIRFGEGSGAGTELK